MPSPEITRHSLMSDGAWVDLRDVSLVRAGERKAAMNLAFAAARHGAGSDDPSIEKLIEMIGATTDFAETCAAAVLVKWYVPELHEEAGGPQTIDRSNLAATVALINTLPIDDYDRLLELTGPAAEALMPSVSTPDDMDKPGSPSEPASG